VRRELAVATVFAAAWGGLLTAPARAAAGPPPGLAASTPPGARTVVAAGPADAARAGPADAARAGPARVGEPPTEVCVVDDRRAAELSGLVATPTGYVTVNDSQLRVRDMTVIELDSACRVVATTAYPSRARDPEDLAVGPDGAFWVADTGDNVTSETRRRTVAVWRVEPDGKAVIHRLTYPDGPHDAEALLVPDDGIPLIITKEISGVAALYRPGTAPRPRTTDGVALLRVGEFTPHATGENNFLGTMGELLVTGAAMSPDRRRVVLRTYTAAYEWDVVDGDVVKAITATTPRITALPDEPQGEAISYTADGTAFVTVSDQPGPSALLRHVPSVTPLLTPAPTSAGVAGGDRDAAGGGIPIWVTVIAALAGLALAAAGFIGLRQGRRQRDTGLPASL
jgi:hypothetical protein